MPSSSHARRISPLALAAACIVLLVLPFAAGCKRNGVAAPTGGSELPPSKVKLARQVVTATAQQQELTYTANTVGTLEPERQTSIAAGVPGLVDEVRFREGDEVDEDTVLVLIDQQKYEAARMLAEKNEQLAAANVKRSEERLALAKDFADRANRLTERQAVAQEEATKWIQEYKIAQAELLAVHAARDVAKAQRDVAERDWAKSQVHAPYAGKINQRRVAKGDFVKDETVVATIADLSKTSKLRLITWIPELAAARVHPRVKRGGTIERRGDIIEFELQAIPGRTFNAEVFYLSTVADPQTHMFECKAEIDDSTMKEHADLKPGLFARVRVPTERHAAAVVIPEESVRASEQGFVAFVPEQREGRDGKRTWVARARKLDLGFRRPGSVEVLAGIAPGETIVTRGSESLEDGTPIEFESGVAAPPQMKPATTADADGTKNGKT